MRMPIRAISGNLRWTRTGAVWADWILTGLPYGLRPAKDKAHVRDLHTALIRALPGQSLILSVCAGLDPAAIVEKMLDGVDEDRCGDWLAECAATLDTLDDIGPGQRIHWLSVPLGSDQLADRLREPARAQLADLRDRMGLPVAAIDRADVQRRMRQASRIAENLPSAFDPQPAAGAQMVWLHTHQLSRGLFRDYNLPAQLAGDEQPAGPAKSAAAFTEPILDEAGQSDGPASRKSRPLDVLSRRFLKVIDPSAIGVPASYQSLAVISDVPDSGQLFPGSEILGRIDESGLEVEWALRLTVRSSDQVAAQNARALRNLNEQYGQRGGEQSPSVGVLDRAGAALTEYSAILESDKLEVEAQATMIMCVAGADPDGVRQQMQHLSSWFQSARYKLTQPVGYQRHLWWAMMPGIPASRAVREYAQITTSASLATLIPLAQAELGDSKGSLLGLNIASGPFLGPDLPCGPTSVILHDLDGATDRDVSGSVAVAGELGSGKSVTLKALTGDAIDRGGRVIVADRTDMGEYANWAAAVAGSMVVDAADPAVSLDPLRLFGPKAGARIAQSFLTPLLNVAPTSPRGVLLSEVLDPSYLDRYEITSLGQLVDHLTSDDCQLDEAGATARVIGVFARKDLGQVIFNPDLPVLDVNSPAIVIRTHELVLPTAAELAHKHLFDQLPLEKIFGRALYALLATLARTACFADADRLGLFVVDEGHAVTISPEAERAITDFVRDGRKHRAAVLLGSHDPIADFGSPTLRGLIPTRILMRHRDKTLAARGLEWLDLDPADEELLGLVRSNMSPIAADGTGVAQWRRGECLLRDSAGNVGRGKILAPSLPERAAAVKTSGPSAGPSGASVS